MVSCQEGEDFKLSRCVATKVMAMSASTAAAASAAAKCECMH